jgi:hypothetical protein
MAIRGFFLFLCFICVASAPLSGADALLRSGLLGTQYRFNIYKNIRRAIDQNEGGLDTFSQGKATCCGIRSPVQ